MLGHVRSTGGLMPVRVWESHGSMAHGSPYEITQIPRSLKAACPCGFGCRTFLWPVGSPYEITKIRQSHEAPEKFTGPIRVKH